MEACAVGVSVGRLEPSMCKLTAPTGSTKAGKWVEEAGKGKGEWDEAPTRAGIGGLGQEGSRFGSSSSC